MLISLTNYQSLAEAGDRESTGDDKSTASSESSAETNHAASTAGSQTAATGAVGKAPTKKPFKPKSVM